MFVRLFFCTVARNLGKLPRHILVTQQHAALPKYCMAQSQCRLHVKVYDKDAGLETKREATKLQVNDDEHNYDGELTDLKSKSITAASLKRIKSERPHISETSKDDQSDPDVFDNNPKEPAKEDEGKFFNNISCKY